MSSKKNHKSSQSSRLACVITMEFSSGDSGESRAPEFQVVITVDYDDKELFPLTETLPKCLLPVANRKLLSYQLDLLAKSGVMETFIVTPTDYEPQIASFLAEYVRGRMQIDLVAVDDYGGAADAIRALKDRIRGDFFCFPSDFLCQFSLIDMVNMHRLQTSDITMMFSTVNKIPVRDDEYREYVGIDENGRVYMKTSLAIIEDEHIDISKALLHKTGSFSLRNDLVDMGLYLCSHWIVDLLLNNKSMASLKFDLVPYLLERQFQPSDYLEANVPSLAKRNRPLSAVEPWLAAGNQRFNGGFDQQTIYDAQSQDSVDMIRCFGMAYNTGPAAPSTQSAAATAAAGTANSVILTRITNIPSYLALNKDIPLMNFTARTPWPRAANYLKKESTVVGEGVDLSDKTITLKTCCLGSNVRIGAMSKLNNCVVMDNVVIGEKCMIQNTVISERAVIEDNCNLNDCIIGAEYKVTANSKIRGEPLSLSS